MPIRLAARGFVALITVVMLVALLLASVPAAAAPVRPAAEPSCAGRTASQWAALGYAVRVGNGVIGGTSGNDVLIGGDGNDTIRGGNGNDILCGGGGDDKLYGDTGNDVLIGGDGNDLLYGGVGIDFLVGDEITDIGPAAPDPPLPPAANYYYCGTCYRPAVDNGTLALLGRIFSLSGGGNDKLYLESGAGGEVLNVAEYAYGGGGNDLLVDTDGDAYLYGGDGDDTLIGGPGNDYLIGGPGFDTCDGGASQNATDPRTGTRVIDRSQSCEVNVGIEEAQPTPTATRTATPSQTPTATPSQTPTATPSPTPIE